MSLLVGVFVGGHGVRMGGVAKGLLVIPGEGRTLVERTVGLGSELGAHVVLVGNAEPYRALGLETVPDAAGGKGPIGGLVALLERAGDAVTLALACDLPRLTPVLLRRLAESPSRAPVVAPRSLGLWEPLCARYDPARALPIARARLARGELSLQPLLEELGAEELVLSEAERPALVDWDRPEDVA